MKTIKKLVIIIAVILLIGTFFAGNKVYASSGTNKSFSDRVSDSYHAWSEMGEDESQGMLDNATGITDAIDELANFLRVICAGLLMLKIATTFIRLTSNESGKSKAMDKKDIAFIVIIAVIFIAADKIMEGLTNIIETFMDLL
ncbi:MAG: hypothetical protein IJ867_05490 [Clostridia bacterium]|nr:hypothetical protein [Clostridia bacterium]